MHNTHIVVYVTRWLGVTIGAKYGEEHLAEWRNANSSGQARQGRFQSSSKSQCEVSNFPNSYFAELFLLQYKE